MLREELQLLQEPGSYVGEVVNVMGKNKVLVKVHPEGKYVVDIDKNIDITKITPSTRVALRNDSYVLHLVLPSKVDPLVTLRMKVALRNILNCLKVLEYLSQREACQEYAREVEKLALKLMGLVALSLGLPEDRFKGYFKDQTTRIRLNHYPPCPSPELALGVGRHKDGGALTVLAQDDFGGLDVKRKTDGEWLRVNPTPNAYIINLGDTLQVWSNERYESTEHRVMVNSKKERFSIPYFLEPSHYTIIKPLEELINEQNPAKYRPYNWGKFMTHRKLSNFKKLNVENIQIHHFRI